MTNTITRYRMTPDGCYLLRTEKVYLNVYNQIDIAICRPVTQQVLTPNHWGLFRMVLLAKQNA
jgi:hypothetical protein